MYITDKIHLLKVDFEIAISPGKRIPRFVNVIIILGEKITLIDSGVKGSETQISNYLKEFNRDLSEIETIILSHSHPDHIGAASKIKKLTNCRILAHELEKSWIEDIEYQNKQRPVPGFFTLVDEPVTVDAFLNDGQRIALQEDLSLIIKHSPGHSKGSINIEFVEDELFFTADSIPLKNDIPNYDNYPDLIRSLEAVRNNTKYKTLLTSWTYAFTDKQMVNELINEGEIYINQIDEAVRLFYRSANPGDLSACQSTVDHLGLPQFMVNPIVDRAFRSHLS